MNISFIKIAALLCALLAPGLAANGWGAMTAMNGLAEVGYIKYEGDADGREGVSGTTLAQRYAVAYKATNLLYKSQPRYYNLMLGYEWMSFDTTASGPQLETNINQSFGRVKYAGEVGFTGANLPITVRAYVNDDQPPQFRANIGPYSLIPDGLIYNIEGRGKSVASGLSFVYEPSGASTAALRALPRLFLDYRQIYNKSTEGYLIDNRLKELAVSLNQQNNWLHYRMANVEDSLNTLNNFTRQQLQVGLIDYRGDRRWSALTNWIEVSADGQLTNTRSPSRDLTLEEYDVNFLAVATRKLWNAKTFMNYNRLLEDDSITESTRVPVYVKGIYGAETDWYASLNTSRERQKLFNQNSFNTSSASSFTAGGTTFSRSSFTLSPAITVRTAKDYYGVDSYSFAASLETVSTSRFSDKIGLGGRVVFRGTDNGSSAPDSRTWSTVMNLSSSYAPNSRVNFKLEEILEMGSGSGYLTDSQLLYGSDSSQKIGTYLRNYLAASSNWQPNAQFSAILSGSYEFLQATGLESASNTMIIFATGYNNQDVSYRFDTKYQRSQNGYDPARDLSITNAEVQYRPNRYHDGLFRLTYQKEVYPNYDRTEKRALQRYSYNLFTRSGVIRNIATLTQETGYYSDENYGIKGSYTYLGFSGRYSPTERLSLYGSVKYETNDPGSVVMYYSAGMNSDFKLLSTSLDYSYAKRDTDNRIEKRLTAYVRRQF